MAGHNDAITPSLLSSSLQGIDFSSLQGSAAAAGWTEFRKKNSFYFFILPETCFMVVGLMVVG
jgi:hypothetical protein